MVAPATVPKALALEILRTPALMLVVPTKVLAPESCKVPEPDLMSEPAPPRIPP